MKHTEAEKLLGGYATGTLTEAERQTLFAAALEHQEVFDALADEEALRELLADPAAKAQLLAALDTAPPKVVPFWRRTGALGAAAGLLVAVTAGLAYLRSPEKTPPPVQVVPEKAPAAKLMETASGEPAAPPPAGISVPREKAKEGPGVVQTPATAPAPAPPPAQALVKATTVEAKEDAARTDLSRMTAQGDARREAAPTHLAKKAEARPSAQAVLDVVQVQTAEAKELKAEPRVRAKQGVPGVVPETSSSGVVTGVVGGVVGGAAPKPTAAGSALPAARNLAAVAELAPKAGAPPTWNLQRRPDGSTQVEVTCAEGGVVVLLQRTASGARVLAVHSQERVGASLLLRRWIVRLEAGDALDLYVLKSPVADPASLPESGPMDGLRVRLHPAAK